jgi:hypothetical protein
VPFVVSKPLLLGEVSPLQQDHLLAHVPCRAISLRWRR